MAAVAEKRGRPNAENQDKLRMVEAVRKFLREGGVPDGQWCFAVKAQYERLMELAGIVPLFIRVWAYTQVHAMGFLPSSAGLESYGEKGQLKTPPSALLIADCKRFGGVLALTSVGGRLRPATPGLIASELNRFALNLARREDPAITEEQLASLEVDSEAVRREIAQLEFVGFALRTNESGKPISELDEDEARRLHSSVRLYVFLKPRKSPLGRGLLSVMLRKHKAQKTEHDPIPIHPDPLPEQLIFDFVRFDLGISREKLTEYAGQPKIQLRMHALKKRQEELDREKAELEEQLLALAAAELQGKLFEQHHTSGGDSIPPSSVGSEGAEQTAASNGDGNSVPSGAGSSVQKQPAPHTDEVARVLLALESHVAADSVLAVSTIAECRAATPDAELVEIVAAIDEAAKKMEDTPGIRLPGPYLRTAAARTLRQLRKERKRVVDSLEDTNLTRRRLQAQEALAKHNAGKHQLTAEELTWCNDQLKGRAS